MNPKEIKQTLLKIAREEGPQTVDLWPAIREKVVKEQKKAPRRFLPHTRLGWVLLITLFLLLSTTAVFAINSLVHNALQLDPGLAYADMQKYGQEVNQTQTVAGFTVSINWIYADENRIGLGVSIQGPVGAAYNSITAGRPVLTDANGNVYLSAGGYGTPYTDGATATVLTFDVPDAARPLPSVLDLHLSLSLMAADPTWIARTQPAEPGKTEIPIGPEAGPFEFSFSARSQPATKVSLNQTVESAGVSLTLKTVSVSMSETQAELCYESSSPAMVDWAPIFQLNVGGAPVNMDESGNGSVPIAGTTCRMIHIHLPLSTRKGLWTLTVDEIVGFAPDDNHPERIAGPWIFRFEVK